MDTALYAVETPSPASPVARAPDVSVVVPCYNEAESLETLQAQISAAFEGGKRAIEVIYVDDGSTDETGKVLADLHARDGRVEVIRMRQNAGKASALATGFDHARAPLVCTLDGDLQDDPDELPRLLDKLEEEELDLICGWKKRRRDPFTKVIPSRFFNWMARRLSSAKLHDFNCGLKVMRTEVARAVPLHGDLYRFIPIFAAWEGYRVTEEVIVHRPRQHGRSKYGASRFLRGFLDLFTVLLLTRYRYRPLHLFGGGGMLFLLAGLGIMTYLTVIWFQGEAIGGRPLLLLGVLLFLTGVQAIAIGMMAEMIGSSERQGRRRRSGAAPGLLSHRTGADPERKP